MFLKKIGTTVLMQPSEACFLSGFLGRAVDDTLGIGPKQHRKRNNNTYV